MAVCPGCVGTEDLEEDLNVDDDEQHGSPESSVHSPPGLTAQTLRRHERQQQQHQHQQPQQHHQQQPLVPPDRRRRKVGSVASGMSGRSDKSAMFGYEMADLCELAIEDLMALRTKCGRWLKHIELEIEERRQEQQEVAEREEAEARAEAARRGRLRAEAEHPPDPQYDPSMPPEDGDWSGDPAADPTPDAIPEPKTEDIQQAMEDDTDKHEVVRMCPNCRMEWDVESAPELCPECPNVELITLEWLPGSDHNVTGFGPRQVCVPVPFPLPLAIPFHNRVYVCFQRHSAKAESEAAAEATEAKEAEDEQTVCGRVAAVCPVVLMQNSCLCVSRATPTKEKQKQQRQKRLRTNRWYVAGSLLFAPVVLMQNSVRLCFQGHAPEGADAEAEGAAMDDEQKVCVMVTWSPLWVVLAVALLHYCVCVCFQGHAADGAAAEAGAEADREQENKEEAETDPESKEKAQVGPTSCLCRNRGTHVPPNCTRCTPTF